MRRTRSTLLGLLCLGLPSLAWADDLTLLAGPPVPADGQTPATVWLACEACADGARVRVKSKGVEARSATVTGGFVRLDVVAAPADGAEAAEAEIRVSQESGKLAARVSLPLGPPRVAPLALSAAPAAAAPGDGPVTLTLRTPPDVAALRGVATAGALGAFSESSPGVWTAEWTPPASIRAPQLVAIAVVDAAHPAERVGWTTVSLRTKTSLTYTVPPDSEAVLVVQDERFGPFRASPSGTVAFEAALPPEAGAGTLEVTTPQGAREDRSVTLPLAEGGAPLVVLPPPAVVPADPRAPVPVRVLALERDGRPSTAAPSLAASRGDLSAVQPTATPGLFGADWTAPAQTGTVEWTATLDDRTAEAQARLAPGLPEVTLSTDPAELAHDGRAITLSTGVAAPAGGAIREALPRIEVSGARATRRASGSGGLWALPLRVDSAAPVVTTRVVPVTGSGDGAVAALLAWSAPPARAGDPAPVTVVAVDAAGLPVPQVTLQLGVPEGSGTLPPTATTDRSGVALLTYDLGDDDAPSRLTITAGGRATALSVLPGNRPAPVGGTARRLDQVARWQAALPVHHLVRGAPPAPVVTAAPAPAAAPAPSAPAPVAQAPEAAPAPAPAPAAPPARAPRSGDPGWARLHLTFSGVGLRHNQESDDETVAPATLDSSAGDLLAGETPEGFAPMLQAVLYPGDKRVGIDASVGLLRVPAEPAGDTFSEVVGGAGVRLRNPLGDRAHWYVIAQAERRPGFLLLSDGPAFDAVAFPYWGLRAGAGLTLETERWLAEVEVTETLAFAPVDLRAQLAADYFFTPQWAARLQLGLDLRSMAFEVADADVQVTDQLQFLGLGVTARLP